jgi:hypothetical protein
VVKSVTRVKRVSISIERDGFGAFVQRAEARWELDVWRGDKVLFSIAGETKESVLRALDDFIAGLIELSRCAEAVAKRIEDMAEEFERE